MIPLMAAPDAGGPLDARGTLVPRVVFRVYGVMLSFAVAVGIMRGTAAHWFQEETVERDAAVGVGLGLMVVVLSRISMRSAVLRDLALELAKVLGSLSFPAILMCAFMSAAAEEALFRGVLLPEIGPVLSTLLFAACHIGPDPRFLWWTLFAGVVGGMLAALTLATGSVVGAFVAHFVVNLLNLRILSTLAEDREKSFC